MTGTPEDFDSRTEPATQRRREEAREKGQVAFSTELIGGLLLLTAMIFLLVTARGTGGGLLDAIRDALLVKHYETLGTQDAANLLSDQYQRWLTLVGGFLGTLLAVGVGASIAQAGFRLAPDRLSPDFSRLMPANFLEKIVSVAALVRGGQAILKVTALGILAWLIVRARIGVLIAAGDGDVGHLAARGWEFALRLALTVAAALFVIGIADYTYQRFRFEQSLRMTRQEVKEELKREEGDPAVRARVRRAQREMARRRMMASVPKATVVVTNPTHLAVALRYERGMKSAPRVVAKGRDHIAERIKELARRHGIPIVERRLLAQALFKAVPVGQEIPQALFYVVAEVVAYVYKLRGIA